MKLWAEGFLSTRPDNGDQRDRLPVQMWAESPGNRRECARMDSSGIPVPGHAIPYVHVRGVLASAGGGYLTLDFTLAWSNDVTAGAGWIAIALVIFAACLRAGGDWVSFRRGDLARLRPQSHGWYVPPVILSMSPYLVIVGFVVITCVRGARGGLRPRSPARLGLPHFREER